MKFKFVSRIILYSLFTTFLVFNPVLADSISAAVKLELQAAMIDFIDYNSVDGKFLYLDVQNKKVSSYYPANLHPRVLKVGRYFVICSDFKTDEGKNVDVDFLAIEIGDEIRVLQALVGRRDVIRSMMKAQMDQRQ